MGAFLVPPDCPSSNLARLAVWVVPLNDSWGPASPRCAGAIRRKVELRPGTSDEAYLKLVDE